MQKVLNRMCSVPGKLMMAMEKPSGHDHSKLSTKLQMSVALKNMSKIKKIMLCVQLAKPAFLKSC